MFSRFVFILATTLLMLGARASSAAQGFTNVGHAGANFLQIPVEPIGAAMGNALVAHAKGAEGLYWNPGAIALCEGTQVLVSTVDWILDTRISFLGVTHGFDFGTIGLSATALTMADMEVTTEYQPNGTGQMFSAGSYAFGITYGARVIDRFSFGVTVKYIYEYIWDTHGSNVAFDFGSVYSTEFHNLRIGMRLANFGGNVKFSGAQIDQRADQIAQSGISFPSDPRLERVSEKYALPQLFNIGIAIDPYHIDQHRVTLMAALNDPNDNDTQVIFGGEYAFDETFFVRGGYKTQYVEQNYSFGMGVRYPVGGMTPQIDYALSSFGALGSMHFISIRLGI